MRWSGSGGLVDLSAIAPPFSGQTVPMGAREDLLTAARSLTDDGMSLFSPAELIARARTEGSSYPDSTLRTHIVSVMCGNAPDHHSTKYRDLERVGRALYRLAAEAPSHVDDSPETAPMSPPPSAVEASAPDHDDEWFWEGNVQSAVVSHLVSEGWRIRSVANTASSEHGVDIEAELNGESIAIEVKGYPGATYARGPRKGDAKTTGASTQARNYFGNALLSGLLMRTTNPDARVVLAFPRMTTFANLAERVAWPLAAASIEVWLVSEDGTVALVWGT